MFKLWGILLVLFAAAWAVPASAMNFQILRSANGQRSVYASGLIEPGDAQRLTAALNLATRGRDGTKQLLLNSPGGSVVESLAMADLMDSVGVSTIVPDHGICGSACASILFVSGRYRTIENGGYLAIHSCYDITNETPVEVCNAMISAHAEHEGVPGGAMMAFQQIAGPHAALVFDAADAACFGLTKQTGRAGARAAAPCLEATVRRHRAR